MLQDYDKEKLLSNGHIVAWRAAHWANWHFEIDGYEYEEGGNASITFGRGGFQGARGGPVSATATLHALSSALRFCRGM